MWFSQKQNHQTVTSNRPSWLNIPIHIYPDKLSGCKQFHQVLWRPEIRWTSVFVAVYLKVFAFVMFVGGEGWYHWAQLTPDSSRPVTRSVGNKRRIGRFPHKPFLARPTFHAIFGLFLQPHWRGMNVVPKIRYRANQTVLTWSGEKKTQRAKVRCRCVKGEVQGLEFPLCISRVHDSHL